MILKEQVCTSENGRGENKDNDDQWEILTSSNAEQLPNLFQMTLDVDWWKHISAAQI